MPALHHCSVLPARLQVEVLRQDSCHSRSGPGVKLAPTQTARTPHTPRSVDRVIPTRIVGTFHQQGIGANFRSSTPPLLLEVPEEASPTRERRCRRQAIWPASDELADQSGVDTQPEE